MNHRVQKILANNGFCSRRQAESLIEQGKVKVNGITISLGDKASETDTIAVAGKKLFQSKKIYLAFHKPVGCVTAATDAHYPTIFSIVKTKERVFPIGRLDYNTGGLLLLTNDGDFANNVMHPRYEVKKTYEVHLDRPLDDQDKNELNKGITLSDGTTHPAKVRYLKQKVIQLEIHEGKNRIVRRMLKELGYRIKTLVRVGIGPVLLSTLKPGKWRTLSPKEIQQLTTTHKKKKKTNA